MFCHSNLISDSLLINSTVDYLASLGGSSSAVMVVEYVMKIRKPDPEFAKILVGDLVERDPRLRITDHTVELFEPDLSLIHLDDAEFVVFDLETTGAKAPPCRIIEIGAYRVKNGEIIGEFQALVNPDESVPPFISSLTGISDSMLSSAPRAGQIIPNFLDFIGDAVLVAHNIQFDMAFLNYEIGKVFNDYKVWNSTLCTVMLSRKLLPLVENHKLKTLANYYSVDLINHHRAGEDAKATAEIFINLWKDMKAMGIADLASARHFSNRKHHHVSRNEVAA